MKDFNTLADTAYEIIDNVLMNLADVEEFNVLWFLGMIMKEIRKVCHLAYCLCDVTARKCSP